MKIAALLNKDFQDSVVALGKEKLAATTSYKLKKIVKQINEELNHYNELLREAQKKNSDAEGKVNDQAFMKDYLELVNVEVSVGKIGIKEVLIDGVNLSTMQLTILEPIIDDPSEQAKADTDSASQAASQA